ncbi:MAG TPA: ATP-binding protein [Puia sp.]|nr:ATP-binding protein [Puia sp.]
MWTLEKLNALIALETEENLHLEYKSADALAATDSKKNDISKDVSAFANSDGGAIIYGMKESSSPKKYKPEKIDPVDRKLFSRETLEQIINSKISPRIHGLQIYIIQTHTANPDQVVYVVEIPKGATAYQASDKRYYRRFNFQSVPMEDWEIKDIINRQTRTIAQVRLMPKFNKKFELDFHAIRGRTFGFDIVASNTGIKAIMLLDCMFATKEQEVATMFVPTIGFNLRNDIYELRYDNSYEPPAMFASTEVTLKSDRKPILGLTYLRIGQVDIYSDFFIDNRRVQVTVVTEDNRVSETLAGMELIGE